jgi:hypothetical protein
MPLDKALILMAPNIDQLIRSFGLIRSWYALLEGAVSAQECMPVVFCASMLQHLLRLEFGFV